MFHAIFMLSCSTATKTDMVMVMAGLTGAIVGGTAPLYSTRSRLCLTHTHGTGALLPMFALLFGEFTDAFGNPNGNFMATVNDLALKFLYIGLGESQPRSRISSPL